MAAAGAARAATPAAAVAAAPLVLMCVTDYPAADEVLAAPGVLEGLAGRTFVQLTNGNEEQVRAQLARVRAAGGRMLAGGILGYPRHIGRPETVIMYAGDAGRVRGARGDAGGPRRGAALLGEDPGPPNAVYVAAFGFYFAALAGLSGGGRAGRVARRRSGRVRRRHARHGGAAARPHRRRRAAHRGRRLRRRPGDGGRAPGRARSAAGGPWRTPASSRS